MPTAALHYRTMDYFSGPPNYRDLVRRKVEEVTARWTLR